MLIQILITLGIFLIAFILGRKLFTLLYGKNDSIGLLEIGVFSIGLGLGCIVFIVYLFGVIGLYYGWIFKILFYISLPGIFICNRKIFRDLFNRAKLVLRQTKLTLFEYILFILIGVILFYVLAYSLLPEIYNDAIRYHLYIPKLYIQNHRIYNVDFSWYSYSPFNIEMLYTLGLLLNGEILAKLINFGISLLTLVAIYAFCKRYFNRKIGIIASLIFCLTPQIFSGSITANTDIGVTFFSFLCIYSLYKWLKNKKLNLLFMSGIFGGLALGSKYGALYIIIPSLFFIVIGSGLNIKRIAKNEFLFLFIILLLTSIWWIKNYIYTGNPIFPFFNKIFKSVFWAQDYNEFFDFGNFGREVNLINILKMPWDITFNNHLFGGKQTSIGFLYLLYVPIGILIFVFNKTRSFILKYLLIYVVIYFLLWILTVQYLRYLMPMLTISCIVAAFGIYNLSKFITKKAPILFKTVLISSFILSMPIFNMSEEKGRVNLYNPFKDVFKNKDKYLSEKLLDYPIAQYVNKNLKQNDRILEIKGLGNFYYYNCDMVMVYEYPFIRIIYEHISKEDLDLLIKSLEEKKINYIIVNLDDFWVKKGTSSEECPLVRIKKKELFSYKSYKLYKVDYSSLY